MATARDPARRALVEGLAELGLAPPPDRVEVLLGLAGGVASWGQRINLSGHRTPEGVVRGLVLEALALLQIMPAFESLADVGSGAGFPGLPIAIVRPAARVTLIESRERRHHFQRAMRRELGLANAQPLLGRAEELPARPHDVVVAQAAAAPGRALRWMQRWVAPGGRLLLPASAGAPNPELPEGLVLEATRAYRAPGPGPARILLILRSGP